MHCAATPRRLQDRVRRRAHAPEEASLAVDGVETQCFAICGDASHNGAVLMLSDIYGAADPDNLAVAARIADATRTTVYLPDIFQGNPWKKEDTPGTPAFEAWRESIPPAWPRAVGLAVGAFVAQNGVAALGTVGFCFGGGKLVHLLAEAPPRSPQSEALTAPAHVGGVAFYGTRIDAAQLARVKSPLKLFFAENDHLVPKEERDELEKVADGVTERTGVFCEARVFAGQPHGFAHQASVGDAAQADEALALACDFLLAVL